MKVNLYDFDHTIYSGDASLDFILFCMRRHPKLWRYLPSQAFALVLYVAGLKTRKAIKEVAFRFLQDIDDVDAELDYFWSVYKKKILPWYMKQANTTDRIASASPEFLLEPILKQLDITQFVATRMDIKTGKIAGENCRAEEKVIRLKERKMSNGIEGVYSDSLSDAPIFTLGKQAYIVKKGVITKLEEYVPSKLSRLKSPQFIRFLFVGGLNALLGILFAFVASLFMNSGVVAFVVGYVISLIPSYFLNSIITFQDMHFTVQKFGKFCVSYIPNFLVQFIVVNVFIQLLGISPLPTYILSVIISVPVTFLLLSFFAFSDKQST